MALGLSKYICVCVCVCVYTHTHTHTHVLFYVNIYIQCHEMRTVSREYIKYESFDIRVFND